MRLRLDCVVCIIKQALESARLATSDPKTHEVILRETLKRLIMINWNTTPPRLIRASGVIQLINELTGISDPYKDIKMKCNNEALSLTKEVRALIRSSTDPLKTAVKVAIAGNIIDYVTIKKYDLRKTIMKILKQKPAINDYNELRSDVVRADTLLYFADNAGEIVFDKLLIEEMIKTRGKPFKKITFVIKGGPMVNDATIEDALYIGLDKLPNIEFKKVSNGAPNTGPDPSSLEVLSWIKNHDLVVSKGQGNYEDLSSIVGIYFLLIVKCPVVAEDLGVNVGDIIIKYNKS